MNCGTMQAAEDSISADLDIGRNPKCNETHIKTTWIWCILL